MSNDIYTCLEYVLLAADAGDAKFINAINNLSDFIETHNSKKLNEDQREQLHSLVKKYTQFYEKNKIPLCKCCMTSINDVAQS